MKIVIVPCVCHETEDAVGAYNLAWGGHKKKQTFLRRIKLKKGSGVIQVKKYRQSILGLGEQLSQMSWGRKELSCLRNWEDRYHKRWVQIL